MVTEVITAAINGIDSSLIKVETDISTGLPCVDLIGSLGIEVKESKDRVRVALRNIGFVLPASRITINLSPADIRKEGTGYDLSIAVSLLAAMGEVDTQDLDKILFAGELGLKGEIKRIKGILPMVIEARRKNLKMCLVPKANYKEASVIEDILIAAFDNINDLLIFLKSDIDKRMSIINWQKEEFLKNEAAETEVELDYSDVSGQEGVKRAMEIAAAGFHNLLMIGPPGSGKTMLAKRLPGIMPELSFEESMEVSRIYSVCGLLNDNNRFVYNRPFLSPHHTISTTAMSGGGRIPSPGIISKAHKGVLFMDELVHFSSSTLEVLRQPLEDKKIHVVRTGWNYIFPADFMLVAAMNPCPCGEFPDHNKCSCTPEQIRRYIGKISGPVLDRIDICVEAGKINIKDIDKNKGKNSKEMKDAVERAVEIQRERYKELPIQFNSQLTASMIKENIKLNNGEKRLLESIYEKLNLSLRGYHRLIKVSRTIADLDDSIDITGKHILEAVSYRSIEEKYWGGLNI